MHSQILGYDFFFFSQEKALSQEFLEVKRKKKKKKNKVKRKIQFELLAAVLVSHFHRSL